MKVRAQDNMTEMAGMEEEAEMERMGGLPTYVVRDSVALNLEGTSLPGADLFISMILLHT
jgi:hypothetical protein